MRWFLPVLIGFAALPAGADEAARLVPGRYAVDITVDVEIVETGTGTIVDSWTDRDLFAVCLETGADTALEPGLIGDAFCRYRETGRAPGHVEYEVACDLDMTLSGTGTMDFSRASPDAFDQQATLRGYARGEDITRRIRMSARRDGACR